MHAGVSRDMYSVLTERTIGSNIDEPADAIVRTVEDVNICNDCLDMLES